MLGPLTLLGVGAFLPKVAETAVGMLQQKPNNGQSQHPQAQQRRLDYSLCEVDKKVQARVLRHQHRESLQQWMQGQLAIQVVANGVQIPNHFILEPKTQPNQTDAYTAVGGARNAGRAVAMRLDCSLMVSGPLDQISALCRGAEPYCIIAFPKAARPQGPYRSQQPPAGRVGGNPQVQDNVDKVALVASLLGSMNESERKNLASILITPVQPVETASTEQVTTCQECSSKAFRPGQNPINGHHPNCPTLESPIAYSQNNGARVS